MDKQCGLYGDGKFYDFRQDPLENSPLAQPNLIPAQEMTRQRLQQALDALK